MSTTLSESLKELSQIVSPQSKSTLPSLRHTLDKVWLTMK